MTILGKKQMSEEDIKLNYITPVILNGWKGHITMETKITDGRINISGNIVARSKSKFADYMLYLNDGKPIAVVEAKDNNHSVSHGLQQAMTYAQMMDLPFAYSSNGDAFYEHDFFTGQERQIALEQFPTQDELVARYYAELNGGKGVSDLEKKIVSQPYYSSQSTYPPRYLSKQLAQVLKAKLLLNRGVMRGDVQDLKDALDLVLTVKKDAPGSWKMEADLAEMYEKGWESGEVLWTRYMGDITNCAWSEFTYSYAIGYNNTYYDIFDGWIKEDPRYTVVMDSVRAPETWDTKNVWALKKLYHGGRNDTPDAPYTAYYFRYAELYLMEAELKARLDDYSVADALAPLNEMRSKRTNPVLPALSASSKKELLRTIFREICVEQFLENGSEYFASLRFINDTDASPAQNKSWIYTLKQDVDFSADKYCWPIPEDERLKNKLADQNPGLGK